VENSKTSKNNNGTLEINHKYLLVYQKTSS